MSYMMNMSPICSELSGINMSYKFEWIKLRGIVFQSLEIEVKLCQDCTRQNPVGWSIVQGGIWLVESDKEGGRCNISGWKIERIL